MHRTLKAECCRPPKATFSSQQRSFDVFLEEFNFVRPHEALQQRTPASVYKPSIRRMPRKLPELEYPDHFVLARTYPNGVISFERTQWYLSGCLKNEVVGLEEVGDGRWRVHFGPVQLGILDARNASERGPRNFGRLVRSDGEITGRAGRKRRPPYRR